MEAAPTTRPAAVPALSAASSIVSIFGFGHDGAGKWTFAGRRPAPKDDPSSRAGSTYAVKEGTVGL